MHRRLGGAALVLGFNLLAAGCSSNSGTSGDGGPGGDGGGYPPGLPPVSLIAAQHSILEEWFRYGLLDVFSSKTFIKDINSVDYLAYLPPQQGRPASLGNAPGDGIRYKEWIRWFNDYLGTMKTFGCTTTVNRIFLLSTDLESQHVVGDGTEPGDPFSATLTTANYKAAFRHPEGPGKTYTKDGAQYKAIDDVIKENPDTLFLILTGTPSHYGPKDGTNDEQGKRARAFINWLKDEWLAGYNKNNPGLNNVVVFNWFDIIAYPDNHAEHPNRLKKEYGGEAGDSHPNEEAGAAAAKAFDAFLDDAWAKWGNKPTSVKPPGVPPAGGAVNPAKWVSIKPGKFTMGSPVAEECRGAFETAHEVTLTRGFEISAHETTQGQFKELMGYDNSKWHSCGPNCPVTNLTWGEAANYCNALSSKKGLTPCYDCTEQLAGNKSTTLCSTAEAYQGYKIYTCPGYRLPTDAEWEYAYRAGTQTAYYNGASDPAGCTAKDGTLDKIAWYWGNSDAKLHPVGEKAANAWGLHDMAGNVWEYSHDIQQPDDWGPDPQTDPATQPYDFYRVLRGGSAYAFPESARGGNRWQVSPLNRGNSFGFRCVRTTP